MRIRFSILLAVFVLTNSALFADDFPKIENTEKGSPPLSPEQALKALQLPKGFHATLFAAEPDVR